MFMWYRLGTASGQPSLFIRTCGTASGQPSLFCLLGLPQRDQPWAGQLLKASRVTLRFHHILENVTVLRSVQLGPAPKNEEGKKSAKNRDSGAQDARNCLRKLTAARALESRLELAPG